MITQVRTRLADGKPDSATPLVSLHDPHARPIRKGRIDRPVEFGYKAQIVENADGGVDHTATTCTAPASTNLRAPGSGAATESWPTTLTKITAFAAANG